MIQLQQLKEQINKGDPNARLALPRYYLNLMVVEIESGRQCKAKLKRIHEMTRQ